jgi:hypothetical protein
MANTIPKIPRLPSEIVAAVNDKKLAVFIGAGVSQSIGCASWAGLAQNLIKRCYEEKCINYKVKETLSQYPELKKIITICYGILEQNDHIDIFFEELERSLKPKLELIQSQNIYKELIGLRGLFITTNADRYFADDKFDPPRITYKDFNPSDIDRNKLYHIHGLIPHRTSLVFTVPHYIRRYTDDSFRTFLETIFEEYVVLFVGYGMSEFELLDFLITKSDPNKGKEIKHFILLPYSKGNENILEFDQYYYNSMGITILGYENDEKGYDQLYDIIKEWSSEINQISAYPSDSRKEIDDAIDNYKEDVVDRIFQIIRNDKPIENYFFKKLASTDNPFPWIRHLKERGYLNPKNNPPPQEVPYWNVLGYLENVATQNSKNPSGEITELLLDTINSILDPRIDNHLTDRTIVKIIFTLPLEQITDEHFEFIRASLKSKGGTTLIAPEIEKTSLQKLIDNEANGLVLKLMDVIFEYQEADSEVLDRYSSVMGKFWFNSLLKKCKPAIAELCGTEAAEIAISKVRIITEEGASRFNRIWIPTIEDHQQTTFTDRYECQMVHFVRDMFERSEPDQIKAKINNLINEEHPIFKRIAVHTINYHYRDLNELFWNWKKNPLDEHELKHELYELLNDNCSSFTKEHIEKVLRWIESKNYYVPTEITDDKERIGELLAGHKKEWLLAILKTDDPDVLTSYEKYNKICTTELDHPGFDYWSEGGTSWGTISPIEKVELLDKSNEEIEECLITYKEEQGWNKPSIGGLSEILRNSVSENPEKFANNMTPFLTVQRTYQHALLWGLLEAWRAKKDFAWDGILNFTSQIIESDEFWNEKYGEGSWNYRNWIVSQIADLIKEGTKDDNHAFDAELLPHAERILLLLVEKTESDLSEIDDIVTSVLNSSKGKIFSAMINYSLHCARLFRKEQGERWAETIKEDFDKRLNREVEPSLEFSVTLGEYLADLYYRLDEKWVRSNINRIFPKDNHEHWEAAFTGYLFYRSTVYKDLYFLLRGNGHYAKGLETNFSDHHITERLVQHICLGYIEEWEKLDDDKSLITRLIKNGNVNHLSAIVGFFWMQRDKLTDKIKVKVKPLWKTLFDMLSEDEENTEYQKIIASLAEWLSLIDELDEQTTEWLKLSAKYQTDYGASFFTDYLLKHASKTPVTVGGIYLEILKAGVYHPTYKEEDIQMIVRVLYEQNQKETADRICNLYLEKGFDFLRTIYENHRNDDT